MVGGNSYKNLLYIFSLFPPAGFSVIQGGPLPCFMEDQLKDCRIKIRVANQGRKQI